MKKSYSILWAGNDESFNTYLTALEAGAQRDAKGYVGGQDEASDKDSSEPKSRLLTIVDGVGIVSVHGTLTNTESWYNQYFGLVTYAEIIQALHMAALDPAVSEILMDVASPGGAVHGVLDAVTAVQRVGKIKRITGFSSSVAASAGFWILAPTKERFLTATAVGGSIGVVAKHVEHSKMAEMAGIKETIVRSGEFKQLINGSEPLSAKAEAELQSQVDYTSKIFSQSVADSLGTTLQIVENKMGQGREFIGQQAVDSGLFTGVSSFEEVFIRMQSRIKKNGGPDMQKRYETTAAMAAAMAGVSMDAAGTPPAAPAAAAAPEGTPPVAPAAAAPTDVAPAAAAATPEGTPPAAPEASADVVDLLKAQLKEKDDALLEAKMALKAAESDLASLAVLKGIVASTINHMTVALGGSKDEALASKDAAFLATLHESTLSKTIDSFRTGGVADHSASTEPSVPKTTRFDAAKNDLRVTSTQK